MVWGAISINRKTHLGRIRGTMTVRGYVHEVLEPVSLPYLQRLQNFVHQQNNARPHTDNLSMQDLQGVQLLPWPSLSPDLSPIEKSYQQYVDISRNPSNPLSNHLFGEKFFTGVARESPQLNVSSEGKNSSKNRFRQTEATDKCMLI